MERLHVIDSHTGGEPTRVVIEGLPDLGAGSIANRLNILRAKHDRYRTAVIGEPRSSPVAVGAYLLTSTVADFGVIFFNNASYLGMCGHGTIGLVATLAHLGRIEPGEVTLETPVGIVRAILLPDGRVSFDNVPAYRYRKDVEVPLGQSGRVTGDIAYGGNWFFITACAAGLIRNRDLLPLWREAHQIDRALRDANIRGVDGAEIDHVELTGPSEVANARNYVRCPGGEYDRSPCGTGTSAKLACLFEDGKLTEGETYRVESIIGSVFEGSIRKDGGKLIPTITGQAYVNGETTILIDPDDPFAWGIQPSQ